MSPIYSLYLMVSYKFSFENSKFSKNVHIRLINFFGTQQFQFLMADILFSIACKELKIAEIAQGNRLF